MGSAEKTKYFTMIRDPVEIFISAWYYSIHKKYKMTLGRILICKKKKEFVYLEEFVRAGPNIFDRKHMHGNKGPNQLLYDFGVDNAENDQIVQKKIEEIDKTFHLVMILENFQV